MIYENLSPITPDEFTAATRLGGEQAASALLRVALYEPDQAWAEEQCLAALSSPQPQLRLAAVTSAGHLVRRFRSLRPEIAAAVSALRDDALVRGMANDALEDIRIFTAEN